jgi:hypothetical protein
MSMSLSVKDNADQLLVALEAKGRRMADVLKFAINDTVDDMVKGQRIEMRRVFDNPRPYTLNALFGKYIKKGSGILNAGIAFREFGGVKGTPAYKYLMPNIKGGPRNAKRSEKALRQLGLLDSGTFTVQGREYEKDQYGDIPGGQYTRMLAELGASGLGLQGAKSQRNPRTKGNKKFGLMYRQDGRPFAIAEYRGGQPVIMLVFTAMPSYQPRYDFYGLASRQVKYSLPKHFNRVFSRMMGGGGAVTPVPMSQAA